MTALPEDALDREVLVRMTVRELMEWQGAKDAEPFDGVGTSEAAGIMDVPERKARRLARRWERESRPEVRVRRKGGSPRSDLLYDRADCWSYRRAHGGGPRRSGEVFEDEDDAIAAEMIRKGRA